MHDTAILLINCPDRKGPCRHSVARVSGLLYEHGANIIHADQHQDHEAGLFFMRVEWAVEGVNVESRASAWKTFAPPFAPVARELRMDWRLELSRDVTRVAIFHSSRNTCTAMPTCFVLPPSGR